MTGAQVAELVERLEKAQAELKQLAVVESAGGASRQRLSGKASGVALALSYVREYL